jgi:hypothetical protein
MLLKTSLQKSLCFLFVIILIILFCNLNAPLALGELPQKITQIKVESIQTFPKQCRSCVSERDITFRTHSDSHSGDMATFLVTALKRASQLAETCGLKILRLLSKIKLCLTNSLRLCQKEEISLCHLVAIEARIPRRLNNVSK